MINILDARSEQCAGALSWSRIDERSVHNCPRLPLTESISLFNISTYNVSLIVVPLGTNSKWMIPLMSKKLINIVLILDFDIRGFFGLGFHHKLFLISSTFHLATSAV
jgi:hypothetical protein